MTNKELTPSEYEEMVSTKAGNLPDNKNYAKYTVAAIVLLVLCGISFGLGIAYQQGKQNKVAGISNNQQSALPDMGNGPGAGGLGGGQGGFANGQRPNMGEVTAVSSDSITIQDSRSNSTQTFKITDSTEITDNGSKASAEDIKTGDSVLIATGTSDTSTASQVMINPSFRGPMPGGTTQSVPGNTNSSPSTQSI